MIWTKVQMVFLIVAGVSGVFGVLFLLLGIQRASYYDLTWGNVLFRNPSRSAEMLLGASFILIAMAFRGFSNFWFDVLDSFMLVTGIQMVFSATGIRLELFGSNPAEIVHAKPELSHQ